MRFNLKLNVQMKNKYFDYNGIIKSLFITWLWKPFNPLYYYLFFLEVENL